MSEFDQYGEGEYERALEKAISFGGQEASFYNEVKASRLVDLARRRIGEPSSLAALDVGAGIGLVDEHLTGDFARVVGLDVSGEMVRRASQRNPSAAYVEYDGATFPFETGSFDLVFASCVLHHVAVEDRERLALEMARVTRRGGLAVIIEHNPINPGTRLAVSRCEFDEDAVLLRMSETRALLSHAGLREQERAYILFFPWHNTIERRLGWLPLGAQYYVAAAGNAT
jgi:SAM-dependent methyltransferase